MNGKALLVIFFLFIVVCAAANSGGPSSPSKSQTLSVNSNGGVGLALGIYEDAELTVPAHNLSWGTCYPGWNSTYELWLRNECKVPLGLNMTTENWTPLEASVIELSWDYPAGKVLAKNETMPVLLTLHIPATIANITTFGFQITFNLIG